ncbi:Exonuclease SbcC [Hyphomicrobiales bacterium]|nr:Exonuclease SbcC [Hyphomicrobiales bacterium]CAH1671767.1 Exonuclease SbcC [Hyphomicrobiales bacterium]
MKIHHIRISNILGVDQLEFEAGQFNEISGQNGTGKTSVLEAIKSVTQTGHDATLLRKGAENRSSRACARWRRPLPSLASPSKCWSAISITNLTRRRPMNSSTCAA